MSASPPTAPPPGLVDDSKASHILAIVGTLTGVALFLSTLRMYVRRVILKSFSTDDWLMLAASVRMIDSDEVLSTEFGSRSAVLVF